MVSTGKNLLVKISEFKVIKRRRADYILKLTVYMAILFACV